MAKVIGVENGSINSTYELEQKDKFWLFKKNFHLTYLVLADSINETDDIIVLTPGIPPLFYPYAGALCKKLTPKEITRVVHPVTGVPAALWEVDAEFDTNIDAEDDEDDPTAKTPKIRLYGEVDDEVLEEDAIDAGVKIQTKAGEPIFISTPVVSPILEITRYENWPWDFDTMLDYSNRTNSAVFWGAPEGTGLMLPMDMEEEIVDKQKFAKVSYRIKFRIKVQGGVLQPNGWKAKVLHHGFKFRPAAGEPAVVATDAQGNPMTVNLQADGTLLPEANPPEFLEFNRFGKIDFNALTLGPF